MLEELSGGKELPPSFNDLTDEEVFAVYNMHHATIKGTSNPLQRIQNQEKQIQEMDGIFKEIEELKKH